MRNIIATISCALLLCFAVAAQEARKVQEPEYDYVYHYLDPVNGALMSLERQTPSTRFSTKFMGYGGAKSTYEVKGGKSTVRFKADQKIELIVRGMPSNIDPTTMIKLVRFEAKKDKRELLYTKVGPMGVGGATVNPDASSLPINTTRYGDYSLKIMPAQTLASGEYGIFSVSQVYCFGVDLPDKK